MNVNTATIKELNKKRLRDRLIGKRESTIHELSEMTGLSVVTVKSLLVELIAKGEVFEGDMAPSDGGRPSQLYLYNGGYRHAVVVYGHQKQNKNSIHVLVVNLFGECEYRKETLIDDVRAESLIELIDAAVDAYPSVGTVCFGLPGVEENGVIITNDYCGIVGDELMQSVQSRGLSVAFINDVNAAVKGFFSDCEARACACLVGIYFPRIYPPGAGMVLGSKVYTGLRHFAGEIGRLLPDIDWMTLNYADDRSVASAVSRLLAIYCRVVAPDQFILYGDFFNEESAAAIKACAEELLDGQFPVNIALSGRFENDFEHGMILTALEHMEYTFFNVKDGLNI